MKVQMALCEALHHAAPQVERGENSAPRGQKTHKAGGRPGVLQDPAPQLAAEHARCPCSCLPSLATRSLADATADLVDSSSLRILAASALAARRKEEEEELRRNREEKVQLLAVAACSPDTGADPAGEEEEEEEEEEKNFLKASPLVAALDVDNGSVFFLVAPCSLRSSSGLRCSAWTICEFGTAHRRLWQWHVQGSFFFLALCSLWLQTGSDARHHGRLDLKTVVWFLSTVPCILFGLA